MLNLLIANKNLQNLQDLLNYISQYIPDIRVSYLAKNGKEVIDALYQYNYDIILLDFNLPEYNGLEILEKIDEFQKNRYKNSIIFLSNDPELITNLKSNELIYNSFLNTSALSTIIAGLKKMVASKQKVAETSYIKDKIVTELQNIGYNLSHHGTHYLAETILLISYYKYDSENLNKNVYPKIAETFNKTLNNVKTNIIHATDAAYDNMDKHILKNYLKMPDTIKPTAKMVINAILKKLNSENNT